MCTLKSNVLNVYDAMSGEFDRRTRSHFQDQINVFSEMKEKKRLSSIFERKIPFPKRKKWRHHSVSTKVVHLCFALKVRHYQFNSARFLCKNCLKFYTMVAWGVLPFWITQKLAPIFATWSLDLTHAVYKYRVKGCPNVIKFVRMNVIFWKWTFHFNF